MKPSDNDPTSHQPNSSHRFGKKFAAVGLAGLATLGPLAFMMDNAADAQTEQVDEAANFNNNHIRANGGPEVTFVDAVPGTDIVRVLDESGIVTTDDPNVAPTYDIVTLLRGERATSLSSTPDGKGYWVFTDKGRAIPKGDAEFFGDESQTTLNGPIVASRATPSGKGYYMVGSDGGIFAFGDAKFFGSMGDKQLNAPIIGIAPTETGQGYWLVARDGGVFSFGDAQFVGSLGGQHLNRPIKGIVPVPGGYDLVAEDGGVFALTNSPDAPFLGSLPGINHTAPDTNPVVGIAALEHGYGVIQAHGEYTQFLDDDDPTPNTIAPPTVTPPTSGATSNTAPTTQ